MMHSCSIFNAVQIWNFCEGAAAAGRGPLETGDVRQDASSAQLLANSPILDMPLCIIQKKTCHKMSLNNCVQIYQLLETIGIYEIALNRTQLSI